MIVRELITKLGFKADDKKMSAFGAKAAKVAKGIGIGMAVAGTALLGIGAAAIKAAGDMEMMTTQFEVMLGSAESANKMMADLKKFAASTPFALADLGEGAQQLLGFGVAEKDVLNTMRMLGDTAGGNKEKLKGLVLAYGKVNVKGKASLEEINMMAEKGLPIFDELTKVTGLSGEALSKAISGGQIKKDTITKVFQNMTSAGGMFYKGMEKQSLTLNGLISTMKDNFNLLLASIGEGLLPVIKEFVGTITTLAQGPLKELAMGLSKVLIPIFKALADMLPIVIKAIVPLLTMVGELIGIILEAIMPVFKLLVPIIEIVKKFMPLIKVLLQVASVILAELVNSLLEIVEALMPILDILIEMILQIDIEGIMLVIVSLLKITTQIIVFMLKLFTDIMNSPFMVWLVSEALNFINTLITSLATAFNWIANALPRLLTIVTNFFRKIGNAAMDAFRPVINWIIQQLNWLIASFNKIGGKFGYTFDLIKEFTGEETKKQEMIKAKKEGGGISFNAPIDSNVNVNVNGATDGNTANDVANAVQNALHATFSIELKKVLVSATT